MLFHLSLACTPPTVPATERAEEPTEEPDPIDTGLEHVGGVDLGTEGSLVFDDTVLHTLRLEIDNADVQRLRVDPGTYVEAEFVLEDGTELDIGLRVKGHTQYREITDKPSLILYFNRVDDKGHWDGLSSVYLHNLTYDPSNLHEHLAYLYFREAGVPASRSAFATLEINGEDKGIYLILEKQNGLYNERWFGDDDGGTWEAGSFNHPCDVNDPGCDCWETDVEGDTDALLGLCEASQEADFMGATSEIIDWDELIAQMTAEMAIAHYDNYGWNINNDRVHRVASTGVFHWTPWSTDLAFGWYPWETGPHCGSWGTLPTDHSTGYLAGRCWRDADCEDRLYEGLLEHADKLDEVDLVSTLEQRLLLIDEASSEDGLSWYSEAQRQTELSCMRTWIADRPDWLRNWVEAQRAL